MLVNSAARCAFFGVFLRLLQFRQSKFCAYAYASPFRRPLPHHRQHLLQGVSHQPARPSSVNCTWRYITQPLDHFSPGAAGTYDERYCQYSGYADSHSSKAPIFFYVGNESPVEEYVNGTGILYICPYHHTLLPSAFKTPEFFSTSNLYLSHHMPKQLHQYTQICSTRTTSTHLHYFQP